MNRPNARGKGFTLVELLVVIAIIGILVALLLPAVQSAREAARRTQCQNNLKQIGIALHNYHDALGGFPPSISFDNQPTGVPLNPSTSRAFRANWIIRILPYMEEQTVYDAFDLDEFLIRNVNRAARGATIATLLCPSDSDHNATKFRSNLEGDNWARGNYAANAVNEYADDSFRAFDNPELSGVMGFNRSHSFRGITDGASNTLLVGEIRAGLSEDDRRGTWAMGTAGASALFKHGFGGDDNGPNACNQDSDDITGCNVLFQTLGAQVLQEECMTCWNGCPSFQQTARSLHPGGVYGLIADGSVQFISDTINTTGPWGGCCGVWDRLILSQDGIPLGDAF